MGKNKNGVDVFTIDLDQDPKERLKEPALHFKPHVLEAVDKFLNIIPENLHFVLDLLGNIILKSKPENYEEALGMGEVLELSPQKAVALQYIYEFSSFCTSVVARLTDGTIIHDRNLDFLFAPVLRNLTYEAHFFKGGEEIF